MQQIVLEEVQLLILENVKKKLGESAAIIKIDVDKNQKLASELNISGVPTLIIYKNGKINL